MKLFIDDANVQEIARLCDLYPIDGVTTNPSILARTGGDPIKVLRGIRAAIGEEKLLFVQAIPRDAEGMIRDARAIVKLLGKQTVVKLPSIPQGFKAMGLLKAEGIVTCGTAVYTAMQAYLAGKAGATYVAPYVNRMDNMGYDGVRITQQIQDMFNLYHMETKVLAASFKNSQQVLSLCAYGVDAATCPPAIIDGFTKNLAIDGAINDFARDFATVAGEGKTMADLIG